MKFEVSNEVLQKAFAIAAAIPPQADGNNPSAFLFVVNGQQCSIYSRDGAKKQEARVTFDIHDVEGGGQFAFPAEALRSLKLVKAENVLFTYDIEGDTYKIGYRFGETGVYNNLTFDPKGLLPFEKDIQSAIKLDPRVFSISTLSFALNTLKGWLPKPNEKLEQQHYRTLKSFGESEDPALAKGNGFMLASNGKEICYFRCSEFVGKELLLPEPHLRLVESFLSRSEGDNVKVYSLPNKTYMFNEAGDVIGWQSTAADHTKFKYLANTDEIVLQVPTSEVLDVLRYMKESLPLEKFKVLMTYNHEKNRLEFSQTDNSGPNSNGEPVAVEAIEYKLEASSVPMNVHVDFMHHLFEGAKGHNLELRVKVIPPSAGFSKPRYMFRTMDHFALTDDGKVTAILEGSEGDGLTACHVTRFAPGVD